MKDILKITFLFFLFLCNLNYIIAQNSILPGATQLKSYIKLLEKEKVAVVANQASLVNPDTHLIDTLISLKVNIVKVFSPEHGFRGDADAGERVANQKDLKTGLLIHSLYGSNKKPSKESLDGLSVLLFDLQDVGVRFYTYLSTLHYVMEACAENRIPLIILDRPNPNAHYIDGPLLEEDSKSFVGMHPVPIVYGMTIGEYAKMINGEGWLNEGIKCDLIVIPVKNYSHQMAYEIPIRPSPNLPNANSIALYPSLCLFEPTVISVGRGTEMQFQIYGHPELPLTKFSFTPRPNYGSKNPKLKDQLCHGVDLRKYKRPYKIELQWLIQAHKDFPNKALFFKKGFNRIAGNKTLKQQLVKGISEQQIRKTWQRDLDKFKKIRKKYLIYP